MMLSVGVFVLSHFRYFIDKNCKAGLWKFRFEKLYIAQKF